MSVLYRQRRFVRCLVIALFCACGLSTVSADDAPKEQKVPPEEQERVDNAVVRALQYLASQQQADGSWKLNATGNSAAGTSLAVMAFMASGHVPGEGPYGARIDRGIHWVMEQQKANGLIADMNTHGPMYTHGISTLMLAEALGMMEEADAPQLRRTLEKGVKLIIAAQDRPGKSHNQAGGWRYQPESTDSDLSATGWQVLALRAAKDVGCDIPAECIDRAVEYVKFCSVRDRRGFAYQPGQGQTPTLTGVGITCLEVCGEHHTKEAIGGADWLKDAPLTLQSNHFYYGVYYTGVGMYKMGGKHAEWNRKHLVDVMLPIQDAASGAWVPRHGGEEAHGPIYGTALTVLALSVDYGYLPIYQR